MSIVRYNLSISKAEMFSGYDEVYAKKKSLLLVLYNIHKWRYFYIDLFLNEPQ